MKLFTNSCAALLVTCLGLDGGGSVARAASTPAVREVKVVRHSYGAYTALILAMKHPELVRSLALAEPPLLRWLPKLAGGQRMYTDFMNKLWGPTGREFRRGNAEQAMRITVDWFGNNGY